MMKKYRFLLLTAFCLVSLCICSQTTKKGMSEELAAQRKANISNIRYDLTFNIPASQRDKVTGQAVVSFNLKNKVDVTLDFQGKLNGNVYVGKKKRKVSTKNDHITVPAKFLKPGLVVLTFQFTSQNDAFEHNNDYLLTHFATNDISTVFPCFDQPDIEAKYSTQLKAPEGWKAIICDEEKPLPSRLYSFIAGRFQEQTSKPEGLPLIRILYRETNSTKVAQVEKIFDETAATLKWMESYTSSKYPFKECGIVILPDYPLGGKEYLGYTLQSDKNLFLDHTPTKDEEQSRSEFVAHEITQLWFGGLVALKNPNETWAKEVIANYIASKVTHNKLPDADYNLNFIRTYQARSMVIDRTENTHPIAMSMEDINKSMYDDQIFNNKVPVMMRMLEDLMGESSLQKGLSNFLHDYAYKEATLDDLLTTLDKEAPAAGVRQFSEVWAQQKGMPVIHTSYKDGQLIISQTDPFGRGLCWRQKFQVYVIFNLGSSRTINVDMQQPIMTYKLKGTPSFIIPNYDGRGYGKFTLDDNFVKQLPLRLITTRKDLNRYLLLETIHEHYLMGKVNPAHFGEIYRLMMKEKNPLIMSTAVDHMFKIAFDMASTQRPTLELCMMDLLGENKTKECRQTIIRKLAANMTSPDVRRQISKIWEKHNETNVFDEHDYMNMAYRLAMLQPECWKEILDTQRERLQTEDLKKEFDFVSQACNPDERKRADFFNSLLKSQNREEEAWTIHALDLLSADIYEPGNLDYITASLSSLKDIQKNSSTNFTLDWMKAVLAHHKSVLAKQAVENFLKANPDYPNDLKNNILEAAWTLLKQEPYVEKEKPIVVKAKTTTKKRTTKKKK